MDETVTEEHKPYHLCSWQVWVSPFPARFTIKMATINDMLDVHNPEEPPKEDMMDVDAYLGLYLPITITYTDGEVAYFTGKEYDDE